MFKPKPRPNLKLTPAQKEAIYALPLSQQFLIVHVDVGSGCAVYRHRLVDKNAKDYEQVFAVAKAYARECDCWINPIIMSQAQEARQQIYPDLDGNSKPDLTTKKYGYIDVKSPWRKSNIISKANEASRQGAIAVITDLMLVDRLKHKRILEISGIIFSDLNRNHLGEPNYTKDQIHWFLEGTLYKYNKPGKK